ncbi:hypothetical protein Stsp02_11250 [Streptomyces sp. NBRC 14336]|nr:hypothetical protein Stsp02_11250 [Streptomyces sp. NBRC 14336]
MRTLAALARSPPEDVGRPDPMPAPNALRPGVAAKPPETLSTTVRTLAALARSTPDDRATA